MKKFIIFLITLILNTNLICAYTTNGVDYFSDGNSAPVTLDYEYAEGYSKWSSNNPGSTYQGVKSATFYRSANVTEWTCKGRVGNKSSSNDYSESDAFSTYGVLTPTQAETEAAKHAYYKTNTYTWTYTYDYTYWDVCTSSSTDCWRDHASPPKDGCTLDHWSSEGEGCGFSGFNCVCGGNEWANQTCRLSASDCGSGCSPSGGGWCASGYWTCSSSEPCLKGATSDRRYTAGEYCYIERNGTGGKWSAWSDWTQMPLNETASQKVETITLYSYPLSYKYEYSTFAESNENINFGTYSFDTYTYQSFVYNSKTYHFYYVPALQVCRIKNTEADQEYVSQMRGYAWVNDTSPIAKKNSAFELTVDVIAATPTKYQWQKSINGTVWNNISGATSAKLNTTASVDGTLYRCVVNDTIISNNARLIVK